MSEDDTMSTPQHPDGEPIWGQTVYVSIASLCLVMLSIMLGSYSECRSSHPVRHNSGQPQVSEPET